MATTMPRAVRKIIADSASTYDAERMLAMMMPRRRDFDSMLKMKLLAIGSSTEARRYFDIYIDNMWRENISREAEEVIIGGGLHAAIYCATRVAEGHPRPLVIEKSPHPGGAFAVSNNPSFFLNSRNRPGELSVPGLGALNVLPNAPIQPCDMSGDEYQRNSDLAFCIRATLAICGNVVAGVRVDSTYQRGDDGYNLDLSDGTTVMAGRALLATGLGDENMLFSGRGERVMTSTQFLSLMDNPFPLKGMRRVAVIGRGDSGKVVIEALTGQGPSHRSTVASLDFVDRIDWYGGADMGIGSREVWRAKMRSRYDGIGRLLPCNNGKGIDTQRLYMLPKAITVSGSYNGAYVNETPYDYAIAAIGYSDGSRYNAVDDVGDDQSSSYQVEGRIVAYRAANNLFYIGPCASVDPDRNERAVIGVAKENDVAIFRYAARTAALARHLP